MAATTIDAPLFVMKTANFDYTKLRVSDTLETKTYPGGEYKKGKILLDGKAIRLRFGPVTCDYGLSDKDAKGISFGIRLDPAVPAEKEIIFELQNMAMALRDPILNYNVKGINESTYLEYCSFLHYPVDGRKKAIMDGVAHLYCQVGVAPKSKFPTRILCGGAQIDQSEYHNLENMTWRCYVDWSVGYFYSPGTGGKFICNTREVKITELKVREAYSSLAHVPVSHEQTLAMLKVLRSGDNKKRIADEGTGAAGGDASDDEHPPGMGDGGDAKRARGEASAPTAIDLMMMNGR